LTGRFPDEILVVNFDFKKKRFLENHWKKGIQPWLPPDLEDIQVQYKPLFSEITSTFYFMELNQTIPQFNQDPYGCFGNLKKKKLRRDPYHTEIPYLQLSYCPRLYPLLNVCQNSVNKKV
jgi:hypothetical protein